MLRYDPKTFHQQEYIIGPPFPATPELYLALFGVCQSLGNYEIEQLIPLSVAHAVQEGEGTVEIGGKIFKAKAGDLFILRKDEHCLYYDSLGTPWKLIFFGFAGINAEKYLNMIGLTTEHPVIDIHAAGDLWIKLDLLTNEIQKHNLPGVAAVRCGWELFELLEEHCNRHSSQNFPILAETVWHIIDSSPKTITNVNQLADALHVCRSTLFRHFKDRYGISVKEHISQVRLERVKKLLAIPALSINEIARMSGFDNPQYLRTLFQKNYNMTPSQWRQKNPHN